MIILNILFGIAGIILVVGLVYEAWRLHGIGDRWGAAGMIFAFFFITGLGVVVAVVIVKIGFANIG